jgi:hypothetical protein
LEEKAFFTMGDRSLLVRVKARPHSRESRIVGVRSGELVVAVRAPAEKGKANEEVLGVVAQALGLPRESIALKTGRVSSHKTLIVPREAIHVLRRLSAR